MKTFGVECAVKWCVCLARPESQYCAVHAIKGKDYKPAGDGPVAVTVDCDECDGSQECQDCDGVGTHVCEHRHCYDEHECGTCDGTGDCRHCVVRAKRGAKPTFEERYIAFAFDPGWIPPVLVDYPWETAS